ncbi:DNA-binding response OmpR family regulator [Amorphus suaedae]
MRVLIVEDEWLVAEDLEYEISEAGYEVTGIARTMAEALSEANASRPDIAVMDVRLAGGDCGVDVARKLKTEFDVRCIFASGTLSDKIETIREFDPEPLGLLTKPVQRNDLLKALSKAEMSLGNDNAEPMVPMRATAEPQVD